jgi:hypothetical protein
MSVQPMVWVTKGASWISPAIASSTMPGSWLRPLTPPKAVPSHLRPVTSWNGRVLISWPAPATPMITLWPQPRCAHSSAARITLTLPMHSKLWSTPQPVISTITCWIGLSWSFGLTQSVAPKVRARSNLSGLVSMAMMRPALASLAPWITARPMPPRPNTATLSPSCTLAVFLTAPRPGGHAAAQQADLLGVGLRVDLGQRHLGHHGVFAEGRAAHVVVDAAGRCS